ncbi:hypothetical protein GGI43DRAFT_425928 [Trichoderma evansii]
MSSPGEEYNCFWRKEDHLLGSQDAPETWYPVSLSRKRKAYENLRRKCDIKVIDDLPRDSWPQSQHDIFRSIKQLANIKYDEYDVQQDPDRSTAPWKQEAKSQARRLIEKAKDCVCRNEATWRFACEPLVFSRLTAEIACTICRKRVWRSEVEAKLEPEHSSAGNLITRQKKREICRCPRASRPTDQEERIGLSKHFIDRAEETVNYPPQLEKDLDDIKRPDRIYGLRRTRNFENLLFTQLNDDEFVGDLLPNRPVSTLGEELLFPFLVVEAKKAASEDWDSICLQTAFPIYTFLSFQQELQKATASRSRWISGPLVWFFASRGEEWRLYTAYPHQKDPTLPLSQAHHTTKIVLMWHGSITTCDNALQLLLLVDYICDWSRDIYRPAILMELRILASADTDIATVITDTDIFSSRERFVPLIRQGTEEADPDSRLDENEIFSSFQQLDNRYGADNIQTFLMSMNENIRRVFTRRILSLFGSGTKFSNCLLTGDALNGIENTWSGHSRLGMPFHVNQTKLHTIFQLNYYMSTEWEQVRDLSLISVSEDAFDALIFGSGLKAGRGKAKQPNHSACNPDAVIDGLRQIRNSSARENLLAAISRVSCYVSTDDSDRQSRYNLLTDCEPTIWELVNCTYKAHKMGELEPDEPFLRISKQRNIQQTDSADQGLFKFKEILKVSPQAGVLIHGFGHHLEKKGVSTSLCLYLFRPSTEPPSAMDIGHVIKETFENFDVYHTTRNNGNLNLRDQKDANRIWNLENWVKYLQCPIPTRQGSPRGPNDSGRCIFTRNYIPWHDPRLIIANFGIDTKKKYVMEVVAGEARAWSRIAIKRQEEGIDCCTICAGTKEVSSDILDDEDYMADVDLDGEHGHQPWFQLLVISGNGMGMDALFNSENIDPQTEGYDMRTPPSSINYFRRMIGGELDFDMPDAAAILEGSLDVDSGADERDMLSFEDQAESSSSGQLPSQDT